MQQNIPKKHYPSHDLIPVFVFLCENAKSKSRDFRIYPIYSFQVQIFDSIALQLIAEFSKNFLAV